MSHAWTPRKYLATGLHVLNIYKKTASGDDSDAWKNEVGMFCTFIKWGLSAWSATYVRPGLGIQQVIELSNSNGYVHKYLIAMCIVQKRAGIAGLSSCRMVERQLLPLLIGIYTYNEVILVVAERPSIIGYTFFLDYRLTQLTAYRVVYLSLLIGIFFI